MKKRMFDKLDFYFVTDSSLTRRGVYDDVVKAVEAGCGIIQYREKNLPSRLMLEEARALKEVCRGKALFIVNDRIDIALSCQANGVHLGQEDIPIDTARYCVPPYMIIGISATNYSEAVEADKAGADYIGFGPVFATSTKPDAAPATGVEMIKLVRKAVNIPIVAIGGITLENICPVIKAGADTAVAISAVLKADDVGREVSEWMRIIREQKENRE